MGIASMIIGIVALLIGFIPLIGLIGLLPAVVGFILGIIDVALKGRKKLPRGMGLAGIVLNAITIGVIVLWASLFVGGAIAASKALHDSQAAPAQYTQGIALTRVYMHSVSQRGRTARVEFLEFWNNTDQQVASFKGKVTLYDRSNPARTDAVIDVDCETPIAANAKIWLARLYIDNVLQESTASDDETPLKNYAQSMEIPVISMEVPKHSLLVESTNLAKQSP